MRIVSFFVLFSSQPATIIIGFFFLGIEELGMQLEEPFSLLPQHKITNGIGLSAEEHVDWYLHENQKYNEGKVNSFNAALGWNMRHSNGRSSNNNHHNKKNQSTWADMLLVSETGPQEVI
jgi:hypothetical protein